MAVAKELPYHTKHFCEIAKPTFLKFIKGMNKELAQWITYVGYEVRHTNRLHLKFQSSQNDLSFSVYAGVYMNEKQGFELDSHGSEIYDYFKKLKYANLND